MLEAKKQNDVDQHMFLHVVPDGSLHVVPDGRKSSGQIPPTRKAEDRDSLLHALHAAQANESALTLRLHRVHDPKGMQLLRVLRDHIRCLEERLDEVESNELSQDS